MVGKTILIVDDEAPIREMIAVALEMAGYECLEAENAQQAQPSGAAAAKSFMTSSTRSGDKASGARNSKA